MRFDFLIAVLTFVVSSPIATAALLAPDANSRDLDGATISVYYAAQRPYGVTAKIGRFPIRTDDFYFGVFARGSGPDDTSQDIWLLENLSPVPIAGVLIDLTGSYSVFDTGDVFFGNRFNTTVYSGPEPPLCTGYRSNSGDGCKEPQPVGPGVGRNVGISDSQIYGHWDDAANVGDMSIKMSLFFDRQGFDQFKMAQWYVDTDLAASPVSAVPEPASWPLLLSASLTGALLRNRTPLGGR
jgi:hypothetical protein